MELDLVFNTDTVNQPGMYVYVTFKVRQLHLVRLCLHKNVAAYKEQCH